MRCCPVERALEGMALGMHVLTAQGLFKMHNSALCMRNVDTFLHNQVSLYLMTDTPLGSVQDLLSMYVCFYFILRSPCTGTERIPTNIIDNSTLETFLKSIGFLCKHSVGLPVSQEHPPPGLWS